jgi:hypothetical protein
MQKAGIAATTATTAATAAAAAATETIAPLFFSLLLTLTSLFNERLFRHWVPDR